MAILIDGKAVAASVRGQIAEEVAEMKKNGMNPGLTVIIVGENPASQVYVRNKKNACEAVGIRSEVLALPESTTEDELLSIIARLNGDSTVHGILVQLPLPKHISEETVLNSISPDKDVDAFHPMNVGRIMIGKYNFLPCTPAGVMEMLKYYNIDITGKDCVVVGRSNIVGKPMAMLLLHANGTVTVCHTKTQDLKEKCRRADILVAAVGRPKYITPEYVKPGAVVIDVGMDRDENGKLCGDVDFAAVEPIASYITPVPGGVGPMTVTMLLRNTLTACKNLA